jgi:hypothetical protein
LIQPDGSIIAAGSFTTFNGAPMWGLVRIHDNYPSVQPFVERHLSDGNQVELNATPIPGVHQYYIEDTPSMGPVTGISDGGQFDTLTGKVRFGPFLDDQPRTLTYHLIPPPGTIGWAHFIGRATADSIPSPVVGDNSLRFWSLPGPWLWLDMRLRPLSGDSVLQIHCDHPAQYTIETSTDLEHWDIMTTTTTPTMYMEYSRRFGPIPGGRYYKVSIVP